VADTEALELVDLGRHPSKRRSLAIWLLVIACGLPALALLVTGVVLLSRVLGGSSSGSASRVPAEPSTADRESRWTVLFRSDDPAVWNTRSQGAKLAIPLREAPALIHYLRLRRMDSAEMLIIPVTRDQLDTGKVPQGDQGYCWNGTSKNEYGGRHLGIAQGPRLKWLTHKGTVSVFDDGWDAFAGSGFGHTHHEEEKGQSYSWRGQPIGRTVFEIAVTAEQLTAEEKICLLVP
jgi:hypothetical protein